MSRNQKVSKVLKIIQKNQEMTKKPSAGPLFCSSESLRLKSTRFACRCSPYSSRALFVFLLRSFIITTTIRYDEMQNSAVIPVSRHA